MELAGLILAIPQGIVMIGAACSVALVICGIVTLIRQDPKSFDERLQEHIASKTFANAVFTFNDEGRNYKIRIICNPEEKTVNFYPGGIR